MPEDRRSWAMPLDNLIRDVGMEGYALAQRSADGASSREIVCRWTSTGPLTLADIEVSVDAIFDHL